MGQASRNAARYPRALALCVENWPEAAPEHALPVEWHLVAIRLDALVHHDLRPGSVVGRLVGPFDEREHHVLAVLGLHGAPEVRDLTVGHVVAPGFDDAGRAIFLEHLCGLGSHLPIGLLVALGHRHHETVGVTRGAPTAFVDDRIEAAKDHALAVERHVREHLLHARVFHHLLVGGLVSRLVGVLDPGEDDGLVILGLYRTLEIGHLALGHVFPPAFDHPLYAELLEQLYGIRRLLEVLLLVGGRHRCHESLDVVHRYSPQLASKPAKLVT